MKTKIGTDERRMLNVANKTAEFFDDLEEFKKKSKKAIRLIQKSKFLVAFTGAGISTGLCVFPPRFFFGFQNRVTEKNKKNKTKQQQESEIIEDHQVHGQRKASKLKNRKKKKKKTKTEQLITQRFGQH